MTLISASSGIIVLYHNNHKKLAKSNKLIIFMDLSMNHEKTALKMKTEKTKNTITNLLKYRWQTVILIRTHRKQEPSA